MLPSPEELQEHMESHKEKEKKTFDCAKCAFKTSKYGDFRKHIELHIIDQSEKVCNKERREVDYIDIIGPYL